VKRCRKSVAENVLITYVETVWLKFFFPLTNVGTVWQNFFSLNRCRNSVTEFFSCERF
jgi:hypothetical protein